MSWFEGMTMRLLQALAACLTVFVYLLRRYYLLARCPVKCSSYGIRGPIAHDPRRSRAALGLGSGHSCLGCTTSLRGPHCKQDPVINDFNLPPHE